MNAPPNPAKNTGKKSLDGKTILLFEDDELVRRATERLLKRLGARVVVAESSGEALESLQTAGATPSWVIADYWFTRQEDGLTAAKIVRDTLGPTVKGLVVTGDDSAEIARAVEEAGFHLLRKPINIDRFIAVLADGN
ncbi:response regulator [Pelagibius litoralis]|uniref:Response regulator n=1 Tax=Pelagibius litoralis TaxID=374515 RepID=A0A967KF86_9PROT|nr:response regulator [Pelagibius litoralis]NIA71160.1 response regulator [Pelagibius litoralis]